MKKLVVILAIALFLKPILPVLDYIVNYDYIAKVLCENKAKPELKCNGKCQLMKELAKASEAEKPISSDKKENHKQEIEVLFINEIASIEMDFFYEFNNSSISNNYTNFYFHLSSYSLFHPPIIIS